MSFKNGKIIKPFGVIFLINIKVISNVASSCDDSCCFYYKNIVVLMELSLLIIELQNTVWSHT